MSWSASSFTYYFIEFYMKLIPFDNVYLLMIIIGLGDTFQVISFYYISRYFKETKIPNI